MTTVDTEEGGGGGGGGSKVKVSDWKRFPAHDFLEVVFTFQTPRNNVKGDISFFNKIIPFDIKHVRWRQFCF